MKRWKNNVTTWCMQAETSSVRHAMITLAESEASEGNTSLGEHLAKRYWKTQKKTKSGRWLATC